MLATSEQACFSFSAPAELTPAAVVEDETTNKQVQINTMSPPPPLLILSNLPNWSDTALGQPNTIQSGVTLNHLDTAVAAPQPDTSHPLDATATVLPHINPTPLPLISDSVCLPPHQIDEPQLVTPSQSHSQASTRLPGSPPNHEVTPLMSSSPPLNTLVGVMNKLAWMKKKQTLDYLCNTFKLGNLPNVIGHWYKLKELLGFQENLSIPN